MKRYIELKIDNNIYTDKIEIEEKLIEYKFNWVIDAEIANARMEISKNTFIWNAGIWYNGDWQYGVFRNGEWKSGKFINGVWYNGLFKNGVIEYALIFNGRFIDGYIKQGEIRGGKFYSIKIFDLVKRTDLEIVEYSEEIPEDIQPLKKQLENMVYSFEDFIMMENIGSGNAGRKKFSHAGKADLTSSTTKNLFQYYIEDTDGRSYKISSDALKYLISKHKKLIEKHDDDKYKFTGKNGLLKMILNKNGYKLT